MKLGDVLGTKERNFRIARGTYSNNTSIVFNLP